MGCCELEAIPEHELFLTILRVSNIEQLSR